MISAWRLGGPAEIISARVLAALADTIAAGVAVRCQLGLAEDLLRDLVSGQLDLVVSTVRPRRRDLHGEPLCDEEFLLVAAPAVMARLDADLLAAQPAKALQALPLLSYGEDLPIVRRWWRHELGVAPSGRAVLVVPDPRGCVPPPWLAPASPSCRATCVPRTSRPAGSYRYWTPTIHPSTRCTWSRAQRSVRNRRSATRGAPCSGRLVTGEPGLC